MENIVRVFQHYAGKKGEKDQMDYSEFEAFMKTELKSFTDVCTFLCFTIYLLCRRVGFAPGFLWVGRLFCILKCVQTQNLGSV